jgi:Zn ribbon nucleic-acid-binding protein
MQSKQASKNLLEAMEQLSEELFDAGWHDGLSTFLWADVLVGKRDELWELAKQAEGWWDWPEQSEHAVLVPLKQWSEKYGRVSPLRCVRCNHYKAWPDGWWIPDVLTSKRPTVGALCPSCWKAEQNGKADR